MKKMRYEDKLSGFQESLLHHIFSFVTTKEAAQTCILSKRWRYFWISLPTLFFDVGEPQWNTRESDIKICSCSTKFVERVLPRRRRGGSIVGLQLRWWSATGSERLNAWINTALRQQQVQEIDIYIDLANPRFEISPQIFASSVKRFKLELFVTSLTLDLPHSMLSAAHLRTLELIEVVLPEGNLKDELVLSCPVLEVLLLKNCHQKHLKVLNLSVSQLKNLVIDNSKSERYDRDVPMVIDFLGDCKLELHTPNLSSFKYKGDMYVNCSFENLAVLISANISFHPSVSETTLYHQILIKEWEASYAIKLLRGICNASSLTLAGFQWFPSYPDTLGEVLASYSNLKNLELTVYLGCSACVTELALLLNYCSSIETLVLQVNSSFNNRKKKEKLPMLPLLSSLKHLKYVAVRRVAGFDHELELLNFFFNSALILERMVITGCRRALIKFNDKLMTLSKDFPTVEVSFQIV